MYQQDDRVFLMRIGLIIMSFNLKMTEQVSKANFFFGKVGPLKSLKILECSIIFSEASPDYCGPYNTLTVTNKFS